MTEEREPIDVNDAADVGSRRPMVIAHRGGVVRPGTPECSLAAIKLAAEQGYDMVEFDVQETADGVPVVFHDSSLETACGLDEAVCRLPVDEVTALQYRATDEYVVTLHAALSLCSQLRLGVMLDISASKEAPGSNGYYSGIADQVETCGLAQATVTITQNALARRHLQRSAMLAVSREDRARIEAGEKAEIGGQFWFAAAKELQIEHVGRYQDAGALVLPAINIFRYPAHAHRQLAGEEIASLHEAGVDGFQIDSVFHDLVPQRRR